MNNSKPMTSLSDAIKKLQPAIDRLKAKSEELKRSRTEPKKYLDFRHLNDRTLEEYDWVHRHKPKYTVKEIPYCGLCILGSTYHRDELGYRYASICQRCEMTRRRLDKLNRLQLPPDAYDMHFGKYEYDSQELQEKVRGLMRWISYGDEEQPKSPSIYIYGTPGNGKTSLLYCLAKEAVFSDLRVKYITHNQMIESRYASFKTEKNPVDTWLNNVDLLLFDELGGIGGMNRKKPDWLMSFNEELYGSMYERWESGDLSIVTTTNMTPFDFMKSIDNNAAIRSRFDAIFREPIKMTGKDRRRPETDFQHWYKR